MYKIVIDTGVFISALIAPNSKPAQVVQLAIDRQMAVLSQETFAELVDKLSSEKLQRFISPAASQALLEVLGRIPHHTITEHVTACRDPKDDIFLSLAVSAQAKYIVTGDKDLLVLHPFEGVEILPSAEFLQEYRAESSFTKGH